VTTVVVVTATTKTNRKYHGYWLEWIYRMQWYYERLYNHIVVFPKRRARNVLAVFSEIENSRGPTYYLPYVYSRLAVKVGFHYIYVHLYLWGFVMTDKRSHSSWTQILYCLALVIRHTDSGLNIGYKLYDNLYHYIRVPIIYTTEWVYRYIYLYIYI